MGMTTGIPPVLLAISIFAAFSVSADEADEAGAIRAVIEESYIRGIHVDGDVEAIRSGFHPEFVMLIFEEGGIRRLPIGEWIESIEKRGDTYPREGIGHEIEILDVTGDAAVARIDLYREGTHLFTDYMSLYRFADGWKIVSKIFHRH